MPSLLMHDSHDLTYSGLSAVAFCTQHMHTVIYVLCSGEMGFFPSRTSAMILIRCFAFDSKASWRSIWPPWPRYKVPRSILPTEGVQVPVEQEQSYWLILWEYLIILLLLLFRKHHPWMLPVGLGGGACTPACGGIGVRKDELSWCVKYTLM